MPPRGGSTPVTYCLLVAGGGSAEDKGPGGPRLGLARSSGVALPGGAAGGASPLPR